MASLAEKIRRLAQNIDVPDLENVRGILLSSRNYIEFYGEVSDTINKAALKSGILFGTMEIYPNNLVSDDVLILINQHSVVLGVIPLEDI